MYLSCAEFTEGNLNLKLKNSNFSMRKVNLDSDSEVEIASGGEKLKLNKKMMEKLKELAQVGEDEEVIISVKSANKNQSGLSENALKNISVSKVITAEFKKKNSEGIEDIEVG